MEHLTMSTAAAQQPSHDDHGHDPHLAHHFDTPQQQFDSGKLGIWLFLVQEVLFFSGLFCAYAVFRSNHPEIFEFAHRYLDVKLGAINTVVLICSSLTAAWSVRAAQMNQRGLMIGCIVVTIACAFGFLGIKYVEYAHKFHDGLLWGEHYNPKYAPGEHEGGGHGADGHEGDGHEAGGHKDAAGEHGVGEHVGRAPGESQSFPGATDFSANGPGEHAVAAQKHGPGDPLQTGASGNVAGEHSKVESPRNTSIFFSIYFAMTGLHGLHVIAGIVVYVWLLIRALRGEFGAKHYAAIDFAALYWHLVDLVWIYLFPLLYLIR
jgi:cytochrome c oxidase subunit III